MNEKGPSFERVISVQDAMAQVQAIMQQEMQKGATDSEPEDFKSILQQLQAGEIDPEEAIARAHGIAQSRQDYH